MTDQQVTGRPRRHLRLLPSWLPAAEEDNEHMGSSGLDRPLRWLAVATGVAAFGFFAGTLVLRALIAGRWYGSADPEWGQALAGAAVAVPGVLIAARRPRHPIGWLLLLGGVWLAVPAFGFEYARYTFVAHPGALPGVDWWLWVSRRAGAMADYALPFLLLLFPTGYLLSRRWRPVAWLIFAVVTAVNVVYAFLAGDIVPHAPGDGHAPFSGIRNPVGLFGDAQRDWPRIAPLLTGLSLLALGLGLAGGIARFRRSRGEERQQLKWVAYALAVVAVVVDNGGFAAPLAGGQTVLHAAAGVGFAAAVTIAVYKYRLYDIDIIINRTLVYLLLSGIIAGGYIAIVTGIGALVPHHGLAVELLAAGLAAVVFSPLRNRLQALVNRMMYGDRDDPYAALSKLATRLAATLSPDQVLPAIVDNVTSALRIPYAAIEVPDGDRAPRIAAARGALPPGAVPLRAPLTSSGTHVGDLVVAPRRGETFNQADRRLLDGLAHHAGTAVHAADLTTQLQRSRERLVTAREEERRRIRRDLHDGLGPALAGITMQLDAARRLIRRDQDAAGQLLQHLREQTQAAIADIRRLVYELRPPALDDLGLTGALTQHAAACSAPGGLQVSVDAGPGLPALPAAVEVAAYRIATEAVTNVTRHADARTATVNLTAGHGMLQVDITDDGRGVSPVHRVGVGLTSMRERAEELGGTCTLLPRPGGGSIVSAELPLAGPVPSPRPAEPLPATTADTAALPVTSADRAS
jgi:signal transduction histidine kinase